MKVGTVLLAVVITAVALGTTLSVARYYLNESTPEAEYFKHLAEEVEKFPKIAPEGPHPQAILIGPTEYDFGVISIDEPQSHSFVIKNNGQAELVVVQGHTTCKCTVSHLGEDSDDPLADAEEEKSGRKIVPPGEQIEITLEWTAEKPNPEFKQGAAFYTNDPKNQSIKLYVLGEAVNKIETLPREQWRVGEVREGEMSEIRGIVASKVLAHFDITDIESDMEEMTAEATPLSAAELEQNGYKSGHSVKLTVSPSVPLGKFRGILRIHATWDNGSDDRAVVVNGYRPGPFRILPTPRVTWQSEASLLVLGNFNNEMGKTATLSMFVRGLDEELKILDYESDVEFVKVRLEPDEEQPTEGRRYRLIVEIPEGSPAMNRNNQPYPEVILKTNHPDAPEWRFFLKFLSV